MFWRKVCRVIFHEQHLWGIQNWIFREFETRSPQASSLDRLKTAELPRFVKHKWSQQADDFDVVGRVPTVTDADTGQTNTNGAFINSVGNYVPKAGTFYNGAKVDKGPSDLSVDHTFLIHSIIQLPCKFELA